MTKPHAPLLALVALSRAACAAPPAPPPIAPDAPAPAARAGEAATELAPTPYTADQIRGATRAGRTYRFLVEAAAQPRRQRTIRFVTVTDAGGEIESAVAGEGGEVVDAPKRAPFTWDELRKHAEFPRAATVISDETVTVPAGRFECALYTVTEGAGPDATVSRFYFAKSLPGAPVLFTTDKGGARVLTSSLVEHRAGE
jgi:hypothetical protein